MKLEMQDKRINKEQQMEKRRFTKLQHEIEETNKECQDLITRIKVANVQTLDWIEFAYYLYSNGREITTYSRQMVSHLLINWLVQ